MPRKQSVMPGDLQSIDSSVDDRDDDDDDDHSTSSFDKDDDDRSEKSETEGESDRDETEEVNKLIRKESKDVLMWREIVTGMLVITAALVTITTYVLLSREEVDDFTQGFSEIAQSVVTTTWYEFRTLSRSLEAMSNIMTSYALASSSFSGRVAWPYVTLPPVELQRHFEQVDCLTATNAVWTSPIVNEVDQWQVYAFNMSRGNVGENDTRMHDAIFAYNSTTGVLPVGKEGPYAPIHQVFPSPQPLIPLVEGSMVNYDMRSDDLALQAYTIVDATKLSVISDLLPLSLFRDAYPDFFTSDEPLSLIIQPVFKSFEDQTIVSYVQSIVEWKYVLSNFIELDQSFFCFVENTCGNNFTIRVDGGKSTYLGPGDVHPKQYDTHAVRTVLHLTEDDASEAKIAEAGSCIYSLTAYPTVELRRTYESSKPQVYTAIIGVVFFLMTATFFSYDRFVKRRNDKVIQAAARSNAIVSSLFPSNIRDRLFRAEDEKNKDLQWKIAKGGLKSYLRDDGGDAITLNDNKSITSSKPLADLFPETTIMFADIVGFTAWSSVREPSQVFILLETMYAAFDLIARRRRIFKVETIGDCYVAVAGLPEPRKDHAVAMAKFSSDILKKVHYLTRKLEVSLGPDTGDLTVRIGLHSGPVTAGVLRGERSRFQLFGDTMNTAARMEHNGVKDKIQVSQETADLLIAAGKCHWLCPREDKIVAKGKGELNTYWLVTTTDSRNGSSRSSDSNTNSGNSVNDMETPDDDVGTERLSIVKRAPKQLSGKTERLIDWNVDVLLRLLQQIVARRDVTFQPFDLDDTIKPAVTNPFDEVKEIIALPEYRERKQRDPNDVVLPEEVVAQLRDYVSQIAMLYNENSFHNFEHASHVTMSVTKLLSRIVAPSDVLDDYRDRAQKDLVSTLHDHTYGITSDPLTQFACVFSALIHDTDHSGAPNTQLAKENVDLAERYDGKSVAEQNSIDLAWSLLMNPQYNALRRSICSSAIEFTRFRQLVVNSVMATDIMDADLKMLRNMRWSKAFSEGGNASDPNPRDQVNRKATIVIEHLIQASDVSHTMQHWHIYRKWNERFFMECYEAYKNGRAQADPSVGWYQGEMGFFDFYIIPLAKKLKECGVFGVSSDEYLQYAITNRKEWEQRGQEVVAEMMQKVNSLSGNSSVG